MCGITGFVDLNNSLKNKEDLIKNMTLKLYTRGIDDYGIYISGDDTVYLGHRRLSIIDLENGKQPMTFEDDNEKYTIVYNGEIYNYNEIREILISNDINLKTRSDTEMLIKLYMLYKEKCLDYLTGIFAFAIYEENSKKLFLARDRFGVKPLFYTIKDNSLFFSSEIKSIFEYENIARIVDKNGISELFGLGPCRSIGKTIYKDIYEVEPGSYYIFNNGNLDKNIYYTLKSKPHLDDINETIENVKSLVTESIESELIADTNLGVFLSGGIDSSIITSVVANKLKGDKLKTFSVDYEDNDINFKSNDFQPKRDNEFIELMKERYNLNHEYIVIGYSELFESLKESMIARDMPGMADIDGSLLLFCRKVKEKVSVALSGEYADEIFLGYPWFYRKDSLNSNTFPWSINVSDRVKILNKKIKDKIDLESYVRNTYYSAIKDTPNNYSLDNNYNDYNMKKLSYLTMYYFGSTLLDRSDRMSMRSSLEIRVPFTNYKLIDYVYNIPWEMKNFNNQEKGILREAFKDLLPVEILDRKKSPYPKTYDPNYTSLIEQLLIKILIDKNSRLNELVDLEYVIEILNSDDDKFSRPWFGQLMTRPQLMAYIIQIDMWLKEYNIIIEI
jgi:asparagine synthase (glutamine-hydrolysing)